MTEPIKPSEIEEAACAHIPSFIIERVNQLIVQNWRSGKAVVNVREIKDWYLGDNLFESRWLDFEPIFRKAGWKVEYHIPAYYENYCTYWTFSKE